MTGIDISPKRDLLKDWLRRARESQFGHYEASKEYSKKNLRLGVPTVALTTIVGATIFARIESEASTGIAIFLGSLSAIAAVLSALQTFFSFGDRAAQHLAAGAAYGSIRRHIDQVLASNEEVLSDALLDQLRYQLNSLATQSPEISPRVWRRTEVILRDYDRKENQL